ncbi:MAG TPA: O-antigen ligase family protein [Granulicella sp.]|jgi:hypothetical protein|nr:O-antigen ligase family protein [Granulicella sp.]
MTDERATIPVPAPSLVPRRPKGIVLPLAFFLVTSLVLLLFAPSLASLAIPAFGWLVAWVLYRRSPLTYVQFVWWLFFLVCFARRLGDLRSAYSESNPMLATPLLAALVCAPAIVQRREIWKSPLVLPFLLGLVSSVYGLAVGCISLPVKTLPATLLTWFAPPIFGFFILTESIAAEKRAALLRVLGRTFTLGTLLMGAYGIYQFVAAPPWDTLWMTGSEMNSIGSPEPFAIRVFSTMNGPGALAYALVAGLLLILPRSGMLAAIAGVLGFAVLLLSSVRAAWAALVIALVLFFFRQRRCFLRVLFAGALVAAASVAVLVLSPAQESMQDRFRSFTDLQDDTSYQQRTDGYAALLPYAIDSPFGSGLGTMDAKFRDSTDLGTRDSGIGEILLSLGWIGGSVYFLGLAALVFHAWPRLRHAPAQETAAACISIALLSQLPLGSVMLGVTGVEIWSFGAIAIAQFGSIDWPSRKGKQWLPDLAAA